MPKNAAKSEINNFIGGLVTNASELNYPPNASPDIENFELNKDGSIRRRPGIDFEGSFLLFDPPAEANAIEPPNPVTYRWSNVAGISGFTILAIQFDNAIQFYNIDIEPLSRDGLIGSVDLVDFPKDVRYSLTSVDGKLVVVAGIERIAVITYVSGVFSVDYGKLKTRDLWGLECTGNIGSKYETDSLYRNLYATVEHAYNLLNQSWGSPRSNGTTGVQTDPIAIYRTQNDYKFPSNSEQVWAGLQYKPNASGVPTEGYYGEMSRDLYGTGSAAAKGYFIIDVINRGTSRIQAVLDNSDRNGGIVRSFTMPTGPDYTNGGATCITEFSGRVFYGGFAGETVGGDRRSPVLANHIFFSQLVKSGDDLFKCYQEGDPTSRDSSDLLETDGGFIRLSGAENILGMIPIGPSLIVVCSNGVWSITGGSDYGFAATNYRVDKISSFGCVSVSSIVEEKGRVFFWGEDSIFVVAKNQIGDTEVVSVTKGIIDKFYQDIPISSRVTVTGVNDSFNGTIRWLYESSDGTACELILDTSLSCIYPFKIYYPDASVKIVGSFVTTPFNRSSGIEDVFSGSDSVLSSTDPVVVSSEITSGSVSSVKYLIKVGDKYTFAFFRNESYRDFQSFDGVGVDAKAKCSTGAITAGDSSIRKQIQFLTLHFKQTAVAVPNYNTFYNESSCFSRTKWDWASDSLAKKWSALKQVFRNPKPSEITNFDVVTSRNMIRGHGRSLAIYFETEPYYDCHIIGWNLAIDGNSKV